MFCGLYYCRPPVMVFSLVSDKITVTASAGCDNDGKIAHIPSEQFHLQPIGTNQYAIPQGEKCAEVSTPPEQERRDATGGKLYGWLKTRSPSPNRSLTLWWKNSRSAMAFSEPMYASEP